MPDGYGADDQEAIAQWLFARLQADGDVTELLGEDDAIRAYRGLPPQSANDPAADYPYVVFSFITPFVRRVSGHRQRALSRQRLVIQTVVMGEDYTPANTVMQLIDFSLTADDAKGEVTLNGVPHYVNVSSAGEQFDTPDDVSGRQFRTVGRIYTVCVSDR